LAEAVARLRQEVPRQERDRFMAPDVAAAKRLLLAGALDDLVEADLLVPAEG
jgi:histidine ammonia-lyase